jgi:hypothetical protein
MDFGWLMPEPAHKFSPSLTEEYTPPKGVYSPKGFRGWFFFYIH